MRISNTGNVGIGTTEPTGKLHVKDGSVDALVINNGRVGIGTTIPNVKLVIEDSSRESEEGRIIIKAGLDMVKVAEIGDGAQALDEEKGFMRLYDEGDVKVTISASGNSSFNGGNVGIGTTNPFRKLFVNGDAGGTTAWYNDSHSSYKEAFEDVEVLDKVKQLNIKEWQYKEEHTTDDNSRHISPFAEEFYTILELGDNEKHIQALDVAGVALKAIQEQQEMIEELQNQIIELKNK
jgi:hypothetical protein